jgi:hypothetical protein
MPPRKACKYELESLKPVALGAGRLAKRRSIGLSNRRFEGNGIGFAMPTEPPRAPGSLRPDASAGQRLHIHGIKEMPAGYDAEVAELFRDLRAASNLSEADLASRLATRLDVVRALEQGALYALPPWAETSRVVNAYGLLLNLDVRPLLRRIYAQVEAGIVGLEPQPMPDVPMMPPRGPLDVPFEAGQRAPAPPPYPAPPWPQAPSWTPPAETVADRRAQPRPAWDAPMGQASQPPQMPPPQARPPQTPPAPARPLQGQPPQARPPQSPASRARPPQTPPPPQVRSPQVPPAQAQVSTRTVPAGKQAPAKRGRLRLLKWGVAALIVAGAMFGLWTLLSGHGLLGSSTPWQSGAKTSGQVFDPDDPRSHKADRLPSPNSL